MRCNNCPYHTYEGSYEGPMESMCAIFGYADDECTEDRHGNYGCKYNKRTLSKLYAKEVKCKEDGWLHDAEGFVNFMNTQSENACDIPGYYDFLKSFGFSKIGPYYVKDFRNGVLRAEYYPFEHRYRIYSMNEGNVTSIVMAMPCRTNDELNYALSHYYPDVCNQ